MTIQERKAYNEYDFTIANNSEINNNILSFMQMQFPKC